MSQPATTAEPNVRPLRADAQRNRDRIVLAAREAYGECGTDIQMDEIARRADVGVGTVYRHFPTKDALVTELGRQKMQHRIAELDAALSADDPWDGLVAVISRAAEAMAHDAGLRDVFGGAPDAGWCPSEVAECRHLQSELISRLQTRGAIRRDLTVDDVQAVMSGLAAAIASSGKWQLYVEMALAGLRPPAR